MLSACGRPSPNASTPPTEQPRPKAEAESLVEPEGVTAFSTRALEVVETRRIEAQSWDEVLLDSPHPILESGDPKPQRFRVPFRYDRLVVSRGGLSLLLNALGGRLVEVDESLTYLNRRWAIGLKGFVLDLESGKTFVHQVANREEIEAAHDERLSETMFAVGDQLWWTTLAAGGGRVWMGRVEAERATHAAPYDVADELMPSVAAVWHEPSSRLLVATHGECGLTAFGPRGTECLHRGTYGAWHLRGDRLYVLERPSDVVVDLSVGKSVPLQTPCPDLTFVGADETSGNLLYTCSDGGFGLHTEENEFLHSEARHGEVDLIASTTIPWAGRFAMLGRAQEAGLIIDFDGHLVRVPGAVHAVGERHAISSRDGKILLTDLEAKTTQPLADGPCEQPKIAHLAADRFVVACVELGEAVIDGERQTLTQRARAAKVAYQRVVDPGDRKTYRVDGLIRAATSKALFVVTDDGAIQSHVFPSSR